MVHRLSVGEISTLIAAVVFVARFILPNAFALVLVRLLGQEENAATWGFVQRLLSSTHWPIMLRTDAMANKAIDFKIRVLNWLQIIFTIVLAIAAVLTPAGLYDTIDQGITLSDTNFTRGQDQGVFGISSQIQNEWPWRVCFNTLPLNKTMNASININCPGSSQSSTLIHNSSGYHQYWDGGGQRVSVNQSRAVIYQSGLKNQEYTVSSFFDIKPRRIKRSVGDWRGVIDSYLPVDTFQFMQSVVDADRYQIIEGLVVDARDGGVGLRNHTVPANVPFGTSWTEDLLFLDLDVSCVDMNLSFVYNVGFTNSSEMFGVHSPYQLMDDGGFANFNPGLNVNYPPTTQQNLSLAERAAATAYWVLYFTMKQPIMNLSTAGVPDPKKSMLGKTFASRDYESQVTQTNTVLFWSPSKTLYEEIIGYNMSDNATKLINEDLFNHTYECDTALQYHHINASNIPISCNLLIGAPVTLDRRTFDVAEEGMTLKRKIYSYAAAIKATIKTVKFIYNATGTTPLEGLRVLEILQKNYDNESLMPLWAIETPPLEQGEIDPLWGLVSEEYEHVDNITTFRSSQLYPTFRYSGGMMDEDYTTEAYLTASTALGALFNWIDPVDFYGHRPSDPNSGQNSPLLFRRWQSLSGKAESASKIVKLTFTNMAANQFQGARGWLSEDVVPPPFRNLTGMRTSVMVPTYNLERNVRFKWLYGVPAFLSLALIVAIVLIATGFAATGSVHHIGQYLALLSAGRLLTNSLPREVDETNYQEGYKRWTQTAGRQRIQSFAWGWRSMSSSSPLQTNATDSNMSDGKSVSTTGVSEISLNTAKQTPHDELRPFLGSGTG